MIKTIFKRTLYLCGIGSLVLWALCSAAFPAVPPVHYIRVNIVPDAGSCSVYVHGALQVEDSQTGEVLLRRVNIKTTVAPTPAGIRVGEQEFSRQKILVRPLESDEIAVNQRRFRGYAEFIRKDNGSLCVVNHLDLDDYIKGVLYHEVSHYWPEEILKAQAVVSRTFALYQLQENKHRDFDVTSDVYSQMYGGKNAERYRINKAVEATRGEVLLYKGKIFCAYFHATCGGTTEDAGALWKVDILPLKGVACGFCAKSPHYQWERKVSVDELREKLAAAGFSLEAVDEVRIDRRDNSGRVAGLTVTGAGQEYTFSSKDFRNIVGPNLVRSTNFEVLKDGGSIVFKGLGWGHGVGLCQWGGYFMAKKGYSYRQIIEHYYPSSELASMESVLQ